MNRMKKILALVLAVLMLISLIACGGNSEPAGEATDPAVQNAGNEATKEKEPVPSNAPEIEEDLTVHENTFFTVAYKEEDGWTLAEDDFDIYDYGGDAYLRILDEDGYTDILVKIKAYKEDHESFRDDLYFAGFDEKAYVAGNLETVNIGGQNALTVDDGYGNRTFFGRNEAAGVTYEVSADNWEDPRVSAVIDRITFHITGTDNTDPPWYWEGLPFTGGTMTRMIGTYSLTAQFLPMAEPLVTHETFDHDIVVIGDKIYLLTASALYQYGYDGTSLELIKEIPLPGEYDTLEKDADGNILLSAFMEPLLGHDGDSALFSYNGPDFFTAAPDGSWGISWFSSGDDCTRYTIGDNALNGEPIAFNEVDIISHLNIDSRYILVSGYAVDDGDHYVFVYDHNGQFQFRLGGEPDGWGLGSITYAVSTANGFLGLDANMREVVLWTADGTWIGSAEDDDLFATDYPWIAAADMADDGSILIVMTDERADESADEVLVFKLSGF